MPSPLIGHANNTTSTANINSKKLRLQQSREYYHNTTPPTSPTTSSKGQQQQQQQQSYSPTTPTTPQYPSSPHHQQRSHLPTTPPSSNPSPATKRPGSSASSSHHQHHQHHLKSRIPVPTYYTSPQTPPRSPTTSSHSPNTQAQQQPQTPLQSYYSQKRQSPSEKAASDQNQRRQETQRYYADMLRQARQALQTLHHHHHHGAAASLSSQAAAPSVPPPPPPARTLVYPSDQQAQQQQQQQQRKIPILPGGAFVVLTGEDQSPAICIPNSPGPQQQQQQQQQQTQYFQQAQQPAGRPLMQPIQLNAPTMQLVSPPPTAPPAVNAKSPKRKPIPLTKAVVETIQQDTRMARWQRVQGYVREQRRLVTSTPLPTVAATTSHEDAWAQWLSQTTQPTTSPHAEIEARARATDDIPAEDGRSLWSGGSAGTNGVDEFVWDDDEDGEDQEKIRQAWGVEEWARERLKREWQVEQQRLQEEAMRIREERGELPPVVPRAFASQQQQQQKLEQQQEELTPPQLKAYTQGFHAASSTNNMNHPPPPAPAPHPPSTSSFYHQHNNNHNHHHPYLHPYQTAHQLLPATQYLFHPAAAAPARASIGVSAAPSPPHLSSSSSPAPAPATDADGVFRMEDDNDAMDLDPPRAPATPPQHRAGKSSSRRELRQRASQLAQQQHQAQQQQMQQQQVGGTSPGGFAQPTAAWLGRTRGAYLEALRRYEGRVGGGSGVGRAY